MRNSAFVDDSFGNLWEMAGSYYDKNPLVPMLHNRMMIMNRVGAYYFSGIAQLNFDHSNSSHLEDYIFV